MENTQNILNIEIYDRIISYLMRKYENKIEKVLTKSNGDYNASINR